MPEVSAVRRCGWGLFLLIAAACGGRYRGAALLESYLGTKTSARYPWLTRPAGCTGSACYDQTAYVCGFMAIDTAHSVLVGTPYSLGSDGTDTGSFAVLTNTDARDVQSRVNAALGSGYALMRSANRSSSCTRACRAAASVRRT